MTDPEVTRILGALTEAAVLEDCVQPMIHFFPHGDGPGQVCACGARIGRAPEITDADRRAAVERLLERHRRRPAGDNRPVSA